MNNSESGLPEPLLLQRAIASSHNGITIGRVDKGQIPLIYANPAFYRLTGYGPEDVIGKDCRLLQGTQTEQAGLTTLRAALRQGTQATVLLRNYRKDGSEFLNELTVSPVLNDSGALTHYVGVQNDVTARENAARAIAALNLSLAQRGEALQLANESLRSFSSSASHDLRAPLASIKGFCAALRKSVDAPGDSRAEHFMTRIEVNAQRMEQLIEALMELARSTASELSTAPCDLSQMAREVVEALRSASPALEVAVQIEPDLSAEGDPALLRSVLQNLLGNALKYSSKTPDAKVHFGREPGACGEPRFFVRDNGAGFDMAGAGTLFGTFQRFHAEAEFPGTGVGLATVRRIVTRHGGVVSAESAPGQGAVFYFTLGTPRG
ncbi:MAG: PAS domain-containing protein [Polaromonas sp.]|uniref:sensor histidine kinase n=1 Tax=Polaromonas sp. TaxID=1869339 RepID=UPI0017C6586E|nr:PAS domain-containing protein [Polaromonas sp.]MBA3594930.1 PAS domain-containing protein [Polaromonas sp.]